MKLWYFCYLENYRSDAFVTALASRARKLVICDFSGLRKVFRGGRPDAEQRRARLREQAGSNAERLRLMICPALYLGSSGIARYLSLTLSFTVAMLYGCLAGLRLFALVPRAVVFYNGHPLYLPAMAACELRGVDIYTDLGDVLYLLDNPSPSTRRIELAFLNASNRIICVSEPFAGYLSSHYGYHRETLSVLPAALPDPFPERFSEEANREAARKLRERIGAEENDLVLTYAGARWFRKVGLLQNVDVQGVEPLCRAVRDSNTPDRAVHLVLLGVNAEDRDLQPYQNETWRRRFHFFGRYQPLDESHFGGLAGADYLCLPSVNANIYRYYDRFKTYEYLAAGRRVLAADILINRLVLGEAGIYFVECDFDDLARVIRELPRPENAFLPEANATVREHYNWQKRLERNEINRAVFEGFRMKMVGVEIASGGAEGEESAAKTHSN